MPDSGDDHLAKLASHRRAQDLTVLTDSHRVPGRFAAHGGRIRLIKSLDHEAKYRPLFSAAVVSSQIAPCQSIQNVGYRSERTVEPDSRREHH